MMWFLLACAPEPPAPETDCNGRDDDQDGLVDEGLAVTVYADLDGDGYGTDATEVRTCTPPDGYVAQAGDCDDGDPAAHPGAIETCDTPADEDCDGVADPFGAQGCVEYWPDVDGDGLGEGDPACTCTPVGITVGGDCDGADVDRGTDCTEGSSQALAGDTLWLDDPEAYWSLLGAGDFGDGTDTLALVSTDGRFGIATLPEGDTALSAATRTAYSADSWSRPVLGDIDRDGQPELLYPSGSIVSDDVGDGVTLQPTLRVMPGPLLSPDIPGSVHFAAVHGLDPYESVFVDDMDGDGLPEAWYVLGSGNSAGQLGAWRFDVDHTDELAIPGDEAPGRHTKVVSLGDIDGDGFSDLGSYAETDTGVLSVHLGPFDQLPAPEVADWTVRTPVLRDVVPLGDVDGDGLADVGLAEAKVWVLTTMVTGPLADVARARIGPETDTEGDSALFVSAGDVGADGTRDLLVTDTFWPVREGAGNMRGALYVFAGVPTGVVDARAATWRVYADEYALLGAFPTVLSDGRVAVGAPLETTEVGVGAVWVVGVGE